MVVLFVTIRRPDYLQQLSSYWNKQKFFFSIATKIWYDVNIFVKVCCMQELAQHMLTSINLPPVGQNTLKAREREVGPVIEAVAKKSCTAAIEAEKRC